MATGYIDFAGYTGCPVLENDDTRVVLGPHAGGRVLAYEWRGKNALALDPRQDGWTYTSDGGAPFGPSGGRFDIGPENTTPPHPMLWLGPWEAEIIDSWRARMVSVEDAETGVRLSRDFVLDPRSSRLEITQTIHNVSDCETRGCHWSRTFAKGHGICVVPLTPPSRFPNDYIMYGPGPVMNFRPKDPSVERRGDFLVVLDTPEQPKLGLDSYAGWFAYLLPGDLAFFKQFATYPERVYGEMAGLTISLWYFRDIVCELEPIGPQEILPPGGAASFTETWWLTPYAFPGERSAIDPEHVASVLVAMGAR